jgi:hypothetical protein
MAGLEKILREYKSQRERSSGKSVDELLAMTNGQNQCQFLFAIEMAIQQKEERVGYDSLTDEERMILAIEGLEREVNNGGYSRFFTNSSNEYAPIIVESLVRIGCSEVAALTRRAIEAIYPAAWTHEAIAAAVASYAETERSRWVEQPGGLLKRIPAKEQDLHDGMCRALDKCDQVYYQTNENIGGRLIEFIKAHKESIRP